MNIETSNFRQAVAQQESARAESDRNRAAELQAQTRRLDRDRIILAGLVALEQQASARRLNFFGAYVAGSAGIETRHTADSGDAYTLELLAELRASLSPLVR